VLIDRHYSAELGLYFTFSNGLQMYM